MSRSEGTDVGNWHIENNDFSRNCVFTRGQVELPHV
jgi:hypothetical protein